MKNKTVIKKGLMPYTLLFVFIIVCLFLLNGMNVKINKLTYDEFIKSMDNKEISEMTIIPKTRTEVYEITGSLKNYEEKETFIINLPYSDEIIKKVLDNQEQTDFELKVKTDPEASSW